MKEFGFAVGIAAVLMLVVMWGKDCYDKGGWPVNGFACVMRVQ